MDDPRYQTDNAVGPDGTAVTVAVTAVPVAIADQSNPEAPPRRSTSEQDAVDATLCHK